MAERSVLRRVLHFEAHEQPDRVILTMDKTPGVTAIRVSLILGAPVAYTLGAVAWFDVGTLGAMSPFLMLVAAISLHNFVLFHLAEQELRITDDEVMFSRPRWWLPGFRCWKFPRAGIEKVEVERPRWFHPRLAFEQTDGSKKRISLMHRGFSSLVSNEKLLRTFDRLIDRTMRPSP